MDLSKGMSLDTFLAVGTTLVVAAGAFVTVRLVSDIRFARKVHVDDYFSIAAIIFLAACFGLFNTTLHAYTDPLFPIKKLMQYAVAQVFISGASMWTAKVPVLILLTRIFGVQKWLRVTCIVTIVITGMAVLAGDAYNAAVCMPPDNLMDLTPVLILECSDASSLVGVILGAIGVVTDIIIFILPLPVIADLNMPLGRKIGLAVVFLAGILAIVASAVALYYKVQSMSGTATDIALGMTLTIIESTIVIICGCVPALRAFWAGFIVDSGLYTRLSSLLSNRTRTRRSGKQSKASEDMSADNTTLKNGWVSLDDHHSANHSVRSATRDYPPTVPLDNLQTHR